MNILRATPTKLLQKGFILFLLILCISLKSLAQPAIISFSPASGPVGTSVTITGTNFNPTAANNIVFIGSVKANVTAATTTALTVTVPTGAAFQPISVTTNGLTAYSNKPFIVTFSGADPQFTSQSFEYAERVDSVNSAIETTKYAIGDIDDDNRLDVVTIDRLNNTMSVYRNTTSGGDVSFAAKVDFTTGQSPRAVAIADIDGDGKPDVVVTNVNANTVSIFKNTTSGGIISFAPKVDFATATQPSGIAITDIDKDGKPDVVINTINLEGYVSILRNTGSIGTISFASRVDIQAIGGSIEEIRTADIDGDDKPDIVLPDFASNVIKIFRNTGSAGNISYSSPVTINTSTNPDNIEIGDLNNDGKPDLAVGHYSNTRVWFFKNVSTTGNIALQFSNSYPAGNVYGLAINDLDGDGKPDIAVDIDLNAVLLFKNISSTGGDITFGSSASVLAPSTSHAIAGDFDNDGKPDMAFNTGMYRVTIWKNITARPKVFSFSPSSGKTGDTITINGSNFTGATSVSFGGVAATSFIVENATKISAVISTGATGDVKVITASGSAKLSGFLFLGPPVISSFTPDSGAPYERITIKGENFTGTTEVKFGGAPAIFNVIDPFTIDAALVAGASGAVSVTNAYGTGVKPGFIYIPRPYISSFSPGNAITGSIVTIKGLNFSGTTSVSFGDTPAASFTIIDSATLQAVVGNGSSGSVRVTNANGTVAKTGFIYYPAPVITSFTPVEAAQGDTVTITGLNFLHSYNNAYITSIKFGGAEAFSFALIDSFTIKAKVNGGASGAVTVESNRGNASLAGFTFISPPVISSVSPKIIGQGTEVTITGQNFTPATSVTFGNTPVSSYTIVSANTIKAIAGAGATGFVTITTPKHTVSAGAVEYVTSPFIYNISPTSGPVGTTVTISGINFQPGTANNTVYFGGVKANIVSATADKVIVTVPEGTGYKPISVVSQTTHLTAGSDVCFNVTFPVDTAAFNDSSFAGNMDFTTGIQPVQVKHADIDGDGKPDMIVINGGSTFVSVFRNVSSPGKLSFAPRTDIEIGFNAKALGVADLDADGKPDLMISSDGAAPKIYIFRNQSTPGNIAIENAFTIGSLYYSAGVIETGDFDLDGRPDIVFLCTNCGGNGRIDVCRNTSSNGNISFATRSSFTYYYYGWTTSSGINGGLAITDFDRDGKPDAVVGMSRSSALFLFRNISQGSAIFFDMTKVDNHNDYAGYSTAPTFTATFGSGKYPDLATGTFIFKNNSGTFSEALTTQVMPTRYVFDLNGDGKQDLVAVGSSWGDVLLRKNTSVGNSMSFASPYQLNTYGSGLMEIGDLDGDSKPEICMVYGNQMSNLLRILRNRMGEQAPPKPTITSFSPDTTIFSNQVLITGSNLSQINAVTFGGVPALYFTIVSQDTILATVGEAASGYVKVTTPGGSDSLAGFTFIPRPVITNFTPNAGVSGTTVVITGSNFTGATAVSFGGVPAASFTVKSADSIMAVVGNGTTGSVIVTTPGGTATRDKFLVYLPPIINDFTPKSSAPNGQVVISGVNFEGVSSVSFGGVPASDFTVYPDYKSIVATVGAGAYGSVTVVNPAGSFSLPGFTFMNPVITSFTPTTAGTDTVVTIKGYFLSGATAVSFGGVPAASFTVVDSVTITAVVGSGASGNVSITTPAGTATFSGFTFNKVTALVDPANVNSKELTVSPNPAHDILIINHPASVKNAKLRFLDIIGHEVKTIIPARNATQTVTSVNGLMAGMYTIIWSEGTRTLSRVFIVQ